MPAESRRTRTPCNHETKPGRNHTGDGVDTRSTYGFAPSHVNQDGGIDGADVEAFFTHWQSGC